MMVVCNGCQIGSTRSISSLGIGNDVIGFVSGDGAIVVTAFGTVRFVFVACSIGARNGLRGDYFSFLTAVVKSKSDILGCGNALVLLHYILVLQGVCLVWVVRKYSLIRTDNIFTIIAVRFIFAGKIVFLIIVVRVVFVAV